MPKKSIPNAASVASVDTKLSVAAGAAATSPAATREHGPEVPHHARLSLQPSPDLLSVIEAYKVGMADFNRESSGSQDLDEPEGLADRTYGKPMEMLQAWACAARNGDEALAALRLASSELQNSGCEQIVGSMVAASLQFFEAADTPTDAHVADRSAVTPRAAAAAAHVDSKEVGKAYEAAREVTAITYLMTVALEVIQEGYDLEALPKRICDFVRALNMLRPRLEMIEETLDLIELRSKIAEENGEGA